MFHQWLQKMTCGKTRLPKRARRAKPGRTRQPKVSLEVQALEERWLPTVLMTPVFGAEQLQPTPNNDYHYQTLSSPHVYLLFWGTYWKDNSSQVQTRVGDFQTILSSPFTSGLTRYGSDGKAVYGAYYVDQYSDPPPGFDPHNQNQLDANGNTSAHDVQTEIGQVISKPMSGIPAPPGSGDAVYVVITREIGGNGSYNAPGTYGSTPLSMISVGDDGSRDDTNVVFAHELAEGMSDPNSFGVQVAPSASPPPGRGGGQICDWEPGEYGYRLGGPAGVYVPSYWYNAIDNAGNFTFGGTCIVPDGNTQQLVLQAVPGSWAPDSTGTIVFDHHYDLSIRGDQLAPNSNDALVIAKSSAGLQVTLNGESFFFDATIDIIDNIYVDLGGGTNSLTVDGSGDSLPENVNLGLDSYGNSRITGFGAPIYYSNLAALQVNGGPQQNTFTVQDPGWGVAVTLNTGDGDQDQVNVNGTYYGPLTVNLGAGRDFVDICPSSQNLGVILGAVTVHGGASADATLTVHGRNSSGVYTITAAGIAGNAEHAPINYDGIDSLLVEGNSAGNTFDVLDTAGAASTTLDTGNGPNTVTVEKTTGNLTVDFGTGSNTAQITPTSQNLNNIQGSLTVNGDGANDTQTVNDQANTNPSTWTVEPTYVARTSLSVTAQVNFSNIANLQLNDGTGGSMFELMPLTKNLDDLPRNLSLNVAGAADALVVADQNNGQHFDAQGNFQPTAWTVDGAAITRTYTEASGIIPGLNLVVQRNIVLGGNGNLGTLTLSAGWGGNNFALEPTTQNLDYLPVSVSVNGGSPTDTLTIDDQGNGSHFDAQGNFQPTVWVVNGSNVTRTYTEADPIFPGLNLVVGRTLSYSHLGSLIVNGGWGGNTLNVQSTAGSTPVTINSAGTDAVNVGNVSDGVGDIQGALSLTNNAAAGDYTALTVDDSAYQRGYWISVLTPSGLTTYQRTDNGSQVSVAPIGFVPSDLSALNIHLAANPVGHGNAVHIIDTPASGFAGGLMTTITTGIGAGGIADEIYVAATTGPLTANLITDWQHVGSGIILGGNARTLDNIRGPVTVNTLNGWTALALDDSGSTAGHTYTVTKTTIAFRPNLPVLTYHVNNDVWFVAGSGVNTINVDSTSAATIVNAGLSGNDTINVGGPGKTLQGINGGYLDFQISKPGSHLYFNDQGDAYAQPQTYKLGMLQPGVAELLGGNPNAPGGNEYFFTGPLGALSLNASNGNDAFDVQALWPSPTRLTIKGGTGTNTLVGPNTSNNWVVSGTNTGTLDQTVSFSAVQNLVGGTGVDVFKFAPAGKVASINGGGAPVGMGDWLDYSAFTTPVTVNLATGAATNVNGGATGAVTNIQDVHGGNGGNTLTGDAQGNILIGGTGADIITGGIGRSLLIGDKGADRITGGSGGSAAGGDILIGGYTIYDAMTTADETALMAILAEWQSADSYATRFSKINTGVGVPGGSKLNYGTTVKDDGSTNKLTGAISGSSTPPVDWFFAGVLDTLANFETGEHKNNK
jgi:hypothetical protein